jgi:hypothetical protein
VTSIASYRAAVDRERARLGGLLAGGRATSFDIALCRVTVETMATLLAEAPGSVLVYEKLGPDRMGLSGPDRWLVETQRKAGEIIRPSYGTDEQWARRFEEYLDLSQRMLQWGQVRQEVIDDPQNGLSYLIFGADPLVDKIMGVLATELMRWYDRLPHTREAYARTARQGLAEMLHERPDLVALLRLAWQLPPLHETSSIPIDRPTWVEAVELAVGLVPVVGSCVAAYEAWAGEDLFGYKLGDLERGILAASVLLPVAGRLAKGGRALYTEARLVSLYGRDAAVWSRTVRTGERAAAQLPALRSIEAAEHELRATRSVAGTVAKEAAASLPAVVRGGGTAGRVVDRAIADLLAALKKSNPLLGALDAQALERVLLKGPNTSHLKGQLLEELVESRIVPWMAAREGSFALGITVPAGKKLEFLPGHLLRDLTGRQITDGVLAYRNGGKLVIAAVFEAKAGRQAARELSFTRSSISNLSKGELAELRANAKDVWREQRDAARAARQPYTRTVDDVMTEYALSEKGGQVRRDIERLAAGTDGAVTLRVGTEELPVVFSPTRTKFFGVIPRGVPRATIEKELTDLKVTFEILGVDATSRDLDGIATQLVPHAEQIAAAAP